MSKSGSSTSPELPKASGKRPKNTKGTNKSYAEELDTPTKYPKFEVKPTPSNVSPFFHFKVNRFPVTIENLGADEIPTLDEVAATWVDQYHQFITDPVVEFVSTVAGYLEEKTESLLIDQFQNLKNVFKTMSSDVLMQKYKGSSDFQGFQAFMDLYNKEIQRTAIQLEYTKLFYLIQAATDQYFSPVLSSHLRKSINDIKGLSSVEQDSRIVFFYLVRHEYWMSKFAWLVATSIRMSRQKRYVSSKKFQVDEAIQEHTAALQEFQNFSIKELYGPVKRNANIVDTTRFNEVFTVKSKFAAVNI